MEEFRLPPSDERFSRLTRREVLEQLALAQVIRDWREAQRKGHAGTPDNPSRSYQTDKEAQKLADTPHYTGDPEFDAVEAQETDPTKGGNLLDEYREWMEDKRRRAAGLKRKAKRARDST